LNAATSSSFSVTSSWRRKTRQVAMPGAVAFTRMPRSIDLPGPSRSIGGKTSLCSPGLNFASFLGAAGLLRLDVLGELGRDQDPRRLLGARVDDADDISRLLVDVHDPALLADVEFDVGQSGDVGRDDLLGQETPLGARLEGDLVQTDPSHPHLEAQDVLAALLELGDRPGEASGLLVELGPGRDREEAAADGQCGLHLDVLRGGRAGVRQG